MNIYPQISQVPQIDFLSAFLHLCLKNLLGAA